MFAVTLIVKLTESTRSTIKQTLIQSKSLPMGVDSTAFLELQKLIWVFVHAEMEILSHSLEKYVILSLTYLATITAMDFDASLDKTSNTLSLSTALVEQSESVTNSSMKFARHVLTLLTLAPVLTLTASLNTFHSQERIVLLSSALTRQVIMTTDTVILTQICSVIQTVRMSMSILDLTVQQDSREMKRMHVLRFLQSN